jgi:hypothetical protein
MAPKRQPSKQKRAAQNRNQRMARTARTANAQAGLSSSAGSAAPTSGGSLLSRLRGGSTGPRAAGGTTARARGAALRPDQPPGYRAALSAVLAAAAALMLCTFALRYPVDADGDVYTSERLVADWSLTALRAAAEQPDATPAQIADSIDEWAPGRSNETVVQALWPYSLSVVLPLIASALGFYAVRKRSPSKVVNRALYATLFGAVLTQGLLLLFLPSVLAMGVAMFQVRKAEAMAAAAGAGGVIEVDEVPDDDASGDEVDIDDGDDSDRGEDPLG